MLIALGAGLVALGAVIAPIPGPGGLPVMLVGTVVLLRHSPRMRRHWVRARRRWPATFGPLDTLLRRAHRRKREAARS